MCPVQKHIPSLPQFIDNLLQRHVFPEIDAQGTRPPRVRVIDMEGYSFPTLAYGYGWVVPRVELYEEFYY